ncbi:hypothetical protein DFR58_11891 [Anaerobacterium chartisolvens]|uniref:Uncharacterized protein n=1 Tax=Anaerobacterium chartisolvens TaxID=1297424 RepID=A0A369AW29_9FIRM|nr:hypothetical protein [Anaerobacterium chartisolvens]RCX13273.1 hypothetical protein DFR58_11891 [Anaerobacterium chartisolvens]
MATYTTNLNLEKPDENDNFRRQVINENMNKIDAAVAAKADKSQIQGMLADYVRQPGYAEATGSANAYLASLNPAPAEYASGMGIAVKINVINTGASTINVDGLGAKSILDSKGNAMTAGKLKSGSIYSLKYNGINFILQGEGGGGTAGAGDVLGGKTFTNDVGDQTGTMVNRGSVTITPGTANQAILAGYHNGGGYVKGDTNLIAGNIKNGVNIFGVTGELEMSAGNAIIYEAREIIDTSDTLPEKMREVTVNYKGYYRVEFYLRSYGSALVYAQIRANNSVVIEKSVTNNGGVYCSEDIYLSAPGTITLYLWTSSSSTSSRVEPFSIGTTMKNIVQSVT